MAITGTTARMRPVVLRAFEFIALWILLSDGDTADLWAGGVAVLAATWASLRLLPPSVSRLRPVALARLVLRFLKQSVIAGVDIAQRALDPRLPLVPGFVVYPIGLPHGPARSTFTTLMSLLPGTVPTGADAENQLLVHCLDIRQPVVVQLAAEESVFQRVIAEAHTNG